MESRLYEGMFLVDAAKGGEDFPAIIQHITGLLGRNGAEPERIEKWAENRLAYKIRLVERGIYVLIYFRGDPEQIDALRRDATLSEDILRLLILRAEAMPSPRGPLFTADGEAIPVEDEPAPAEEAEEAAAAEEAPAPPESAGETTEAPTAEAPAES
ncbi:MAG: 30S ribosomal protein S6 [Candidatus Brocadiia bacterium]|nr:30S ribosomal protein S6 [Candidatus Brocadiia bacterium]